MRGVGVAHIALRCSSCGERHAADVATLGCKECGSPLDVEYLGDHEAERGAQPLNWKGPPIPLPLSETGSIVSMGEGNTPTVALPAVGRELGLERLYGKLEFLNPTGSYKDRGTSVMLAAVSEHGVREVVEDSSGNAGASVAAYSARSGMKAHVFVPAGAPEAKLKQIRVHGAEVHAIEGTREATTETAVSFAREQRLVYASHALSPYFPEGTKTFAYEIYQEYGRELPMHIVFPVGNGGLLLGAWRGFQELLEGGRIDRIPRLHCVQSTAVMPIAAAHNGAAWDGGQATKTIAGGISVAAPPRQGQVLEALRATGGDALAVDDQDILRFQRLLAEGDGIHAEPTSAAAFAGLERLISECSVLEGDAVLVPVTGSGLKG